MFKKTKQNKTKTIWRNDYITNELWQQTWGRHTPEWQFQCSLQHVCHVASAAGYVRFASVIKIWVTSRQEGKTKYRQREMYSANIRYTQCVCVSKKKKKKKKKFGNCWPSCHTPTERVSFFLSLCLIVGGQENDHWGSVLLDIAPVMLRQRGNNFDVVYRTAVRHFASGNSHWLLLLAAAAIVAHHLTLRVFAYIK